MPHKFHSFRFIVWPPNGKSKSASNGKREDSKITSAEKEEKGILFRNGKYYFPLSFCIWIFILP